ncbi:MAG: HlyD family efflux transporter periplasmic adaptor subunit [Pseudomonadota bacterium]
MRFVTRSLVGLYVFLLTLGLLALGVATVRDALDERASEASRGAAPGERVFAVGVAPLEPQEIAPLLTTYGEVRSAVQLELRAAAEGTILELAEGFREGGRVTAGETLFRIDPAEFETELALAETDLANAQAELVDSRIALELAAEDLAAAERQRDLQRRALTRSEDLQSRGVATTADLETSELALSAAEQTLTRLRLDMAEARARIGRGEIAERRATIERDEALRDLENTLSFAPFSGLLADVDAVLGRRVSLNERLGTLIDPTAFEVAFRVSNGEYARLSDDNGVPLPLPIRASLDLGGRSVSVDGMIDRVGALSTGGQSGRLLFASLAPDAGRLLKPGDFLTVEITEPVLRDVALVPASALSAGADLLVLGADDRLEEIRVQVLRRLGDQMIVGDVPFGQDYVVVRLPQLGPGILVRPIRPEPIPPEAARAAAAPALQGG